LAQAHSSNRHLDLVFKSLADRIHPPHEPPTTRRSSAARDHVDRTKCGRTKQTLLREFSHLDGKTTHGGQATTPSKKNETVEMSAP
jgi:hypothetical protein